MLEKLIGESKALERAIAGEELNMQDGLELMKYDNIYTIGAVADAIRKNLLVIKLHSLRHRILITLMFVLPVVRYAHFTEKKMMMMHIHCH
uniref:Radical SAM domain-containing protein n=1 Tax=uncultured marine thaumarchaeote SAT1000_31_A02 TaxID=1456404 RepID=A0A075I730_9ARCH|nr:radical SAM domain-containing protein [uncultured marine thaumarchaeote SAT1000_31_A02]